MAQSFGPKLCAHRPWKKEPLARSLTRYSSVAIVLHWLIALLILGNIALAWTFQNTPQGLLWFKLIQLHKSVGITVLLLSVIRLAWRLINPPPPEPNSLKPWERIASQIVHWGFYLIMIAMPLSGWVLVSASLKSLPTVLYGVVPWPHIGAVHALPVDARKMWSSNAANTHGALAWLAYALIVLHVGAAMKHALLDRDSVIGRMIPFLRSAKHA
jgi:cytochrome b561